MILQVKNKKVFALFGAIPDREKRYFYFKPANPLTGLNAEAIIEIAKTPTSTLSKRRSLID